MQEKEKPAAMGVATSKRKRGSESVLFILTLLVLAVTSICVAWPIQTVEISKTYSVRTGETIWHIANDVKKRGDVRSTDEIIWQIRNDNHIKDGRNIQPGDKITVLMQLPKK